MTDATLNPVGFTGQVKAEAKELIHSVEYAASSRCFLYPIRGIRYIFKNRSFQIPIVKHILPTLILSMGVTGAMFTFTYLPQSGVLALVNGPIGFINGALLVLNESSQIVLAVSRLWWLNKACVDTFDAVLLNEHQEDLVKHGRIIQDVDDRSINDPRSPLDMLGPTLSIPHGGESVIRSLLGYVFMLPISFIPIIGTPLFLLLQSRRLGIWNHARYYQLKQFSRQNRQRFIRHNQGAYISYGLTCVGLNLIPLGNFMFAVTNTVGAALWAVDLEKQSSVSIDTPSEKQDLDV